MCACSPVKAAHTHITLFEINVCSPIEAASVKLNKERSPCMLFNRDSLWIGHNQKLFMLSRWDSLFLRAILQLFSFPFGKSAWLSVFCVLNIIHERLSIFHFDLTIIDLQTEKLIVQIGSDKLVKNTSDLYPPSLVMSDMLNFDNLRRCVPQDKNNDKLGRIEKIH